MGEERVHSSVSITGPNSTEHPVFHGPPPLASPSPPWEMSPSAEILPSASCWELRVKLGVSLALNWFPPKPPTPIKAVSGLFVLSVPSRPMRQNHRPQKHPVSLETFPRLVCAAVKKVPQTRVGVCKKCNLQNPPPPKKQYKHRRCFYWIKRFWVHRVKILNYKYLI